HAVRKNVALVRLLRRRNRQIRGLIAIQNVDEFLLLKGSDQHGTSLRVYCNILARHYSSYAALSECLFVYFYKSLLFCVELQNRNAPAVRTEDQIIASTTWKTKRT